MQSENHDRIENCITPIVIIIVCAIMAVIVCYVVEESSWAKRIIDVLEPIGTCSAVIAAIWLAHSDVRRRNIEKEENRKRMESMIRKVIEPEASRLLENLLDLYTTMLRIINLQINNQQQGLDKIEWLESRLRMDATNKFLMALDNLSNEDGIAYASVVGLLPSLLNASQQFRSAQRTGNPFATFRKEALEYGIGSIANLLVKALKISSGSPQIGNLQGAIDASKR